MKQSFKDDIWIYNMIRIDQSKQKFCDLLLSPKFDLQNFHEILSDFEFRDDFK